METALYAKSYFTIARCSLLLSCKIELFASALNYFQLQIITTKSSILYVGGAIFDKVIFHLAQTTVISFNLITIYGKSCLYGNNTMKHFTREESRLLLASKVELCVTKVNGFQCKLLPQTAYS